MVRMRVDRPTVRVPVFDMGAAVGSSGIDSSADVGALVGAAVD